MNTTVRMKASDITKDWHVIDASGRPLGRVASEAAILLRGKHKPTYEPHLDDGDFVIVINASQVRVTGRKAEQIKYYTHSGYPGGLKTRSYSEQLGRHPARVIEQAVWGMLPSGPLAEAVLKHLKVYPGPNHPHKSQVTGSERARAVREAAAQAAIGAPMKAPRLRPLSIPQLPPAEPMLEEVAVLEAPAPKRAPRKVAAAPVELVPELAPVVAEVPVAAAPAETEAPKPRARRKKAEEPTAEAASAAEAAAPAEPAKKPRRRATPKTEE